MSGTNTPNCDSPPIFSLVVRSKKALQHGEQLCLKAHELSRGSTQVAAELLALSAKVRWVAQGITEQLKIVNGVAKSIETKRQDLMNRAKKWDKERSFHSSNLDKMLEELEAQAVPPEFHQSAASDDASAIFGDQHSHLEGLNGKGGQRANGRSSSKWKTLRDFVHERAIVDAIESMDNDRNGLDDILSITESYPQLLHDSVSTFRESLPKIGDLPQVRDMFQSQERVTVDMAHQLESLAKHFEQMEAALREHEAGEELGEEDIVEMNRDVGELPLIIGDLEDGVEVIQGNFDILSRAKSEWRDHLNEYELALTRLDNVGEAMSSMLEHQASVAIDFEEHLAPLQEHIVELENLYVTYKSYQFSYNKLIMEMERRHRYRETVSEVVQNMLRQITDLREDELRRRAEFCAEHGEVLPQEFRVSIEDEPTLWKIVPENQSAMEDLPPIDSSILREAHNFLNMTEGNGRPP